MADQAPATAACPLTFGPLTCDLPAGHRDWHHCPPCPTETENTMSATTQATERTADHDAVERDVEAIEQALDHLRRLLDDRSMRRDNATAAGATLAYEVERYLDDPEGVGTDALRKAWGVFMARHSGNFTDSAMAVDGT